MYDNNRLQQLQCFMFTYDGNICEMRKENGLFMVHSQTCLFMRGQRRSAQTLPEISSYTGTWAVLPDSANQSIVVIRLTKALESLCCTRPGKSHSLARLKLLESLASKPRSHNHLFETSTATYLHGVESRSDLHCVGTCISCHGGQAISDPAALATPSHEIPMLNQYSVVFCILVPDRCSL